MTPSQFYPVSSVVLAKSQGFVGIQRLNELLKDHIEVVALLLFALAYMSYSYHEKNVIQNVLESPRKHDFFYADYHAIDPSTDARFKYVPMKILHIDERGIRFKVGNIAHTKAVSPTQHAKFDKTLLMRNYFRKDELFLSHQSIDELIAKGAIYNARRPRNIYIGGWIVLHQHEIITDD